MAKTDGPKIGQTLAALRKARRLSQNQLGLAAGIAGPMINRIESGERADMRVGTALRIARVLNVPLDLLAGSMPDLLVHEKDGTATGFVYVAGNAAAERRLAEALDKAGYNVVLQPKPREITRTKEWLSSFDNAEDLRSVVSRLEKRISDLERGDAE